MSSDSAADEREQEPADESSNASDPEDGEEDETGFKKKLEEIDDILEALQKGDLELEESLEKYEASIGLLRDCKEILNRSEEKIELLKEEGEEILMEPFEPEEDPDEEE